MLEKRTHQFRVFADFGELSDHALIQLLAFYSGRRALPVRFAWLYTSSPGFSSGA